MNTRQANSPDGRCQAGLAEGTPAVWRGDTGYIVASGVIIIGYPRGGAAPGLS